ncbi:MAG TPA: tetratricopeptide repeat protein [Bryobacteraceae bacterium]|nr:tetratricopeptide repeat protein [Bryobacteraceae bacterium]
MRVLFCFWVAIQMAGAQSPDSAEAHLRRATALHQKRDYTNAIPELRRALKLRPDLNQAHRLLGEALMAQGFAAEAEPHLKRGGLLYLHALSLIATNRLPEGIQELLQVQARTPEDPDVLFHLGRASGELMQQSFNRLMRLHPQSPQALELMAQTYLGQGRPELAEPAFRNALKMRPAQPGIHMALGRIMADRGDLEGAEKELRAEAAISPGNAENAWRLGTVLLKKGQSREALAELERSDKLKPDMLEVLLELGRAYVMEAQLPQARDTFLRMVRIEDVSDLAATAHMQLSQIYRKLGQGEEAAKHLKRFRELSPREGAKPQ